MVGRKYYLKRRQFPGHDGAPEKATTASGHDGAFRPGDAHLDDDGDGDDNDDNLGMTDLNQEDGDDDDDGGDDVDNLA